MNLVFIHQNGYGQYRHIAKALTDQGGHTIHWISQRGDFKHDGITHHRYQPRPPKEDVQVHPFLRKLNKATINGESTFNILAQLRKNGFQPDVIIGHQGWGEMTFAKDACPDAAILTYFEFYYGGQGSDMGFDKEFPMAAQNMRRSHIWNTENLIGLMNCDAGQCPTEWQASRYPTDLRKKIQVIHEGVDTVAIAPKADATLKLPCFPEGVSFKHGDPLITFVGRNLEPYRGVHSFFRAIPHIQRLMPEAHILVVGGDGVSYGSAPPGGGSWKDHMMKEVGAGLDMSRLHFSGNLPREQFTTLFQVSACHVYLTYPFVLSWSSLESLAAGCPTVASDTAPVREVMVDGKNGWLVDFFDPKAIAEKAVWVAKNRGKPAIEKVRKAARESMVAQYDLETVCLPKHMKLIRGLAK